MIRAIRACSLVMLLFICSISKGQGFDYSVSVSIGAYIPITGTTIASAPTDWSLGTYRLPIGFNIAVDGDTIDTLSIEPQGIIRFGTNSAMVAYHGVRCKLDTNSNNISSELIYNISGTAGSRILKIEYSDCGYDIRDTSEYLNYQVWLYEQDGKIEIHTGPSSYTGFTGYTGPTPLVGFVDPLQGNSVAGLLLTGSGNAPSAIVLNNGNSLQYMDFIPVPGKIYTFSPNSN